MILSFQKKVFGVGLSVTSLTFHRHHSGSQSPQVMTQAPGSCGPSPGWL